MYLPFLSVANLTEKESRRICRPFGAGKLDYGGSLGFRQPRDEEGPGEKEY